MKRHGVLAVGMGALLALSAANASAAQPDHPRWVAAWSSPAVVAPSPSDGSSALPYRNVTVRQLVRTSAAGKRLRLRLTNDLGESPVHVGEVEVAPCQADETMKTPTSRRVSFSGRTEFTIPAGAPAYSDPVDLRVTVLQCLAVSVYFPDIAEPAAHYMGVSVSAPGDHAREGMWPGARQLRRPGIVSRVDVENESGARTLVALGDSITAGAGATRGANLDWPGQLAARLSRRGWSVTNAGVEGNRLIHGDAGEGPSALARLDRDVLAVPGAAAVIVLEGVNDIGFSAQPRYRTEAVSAADIIAADRQIIARAHAHGLRVIGGTLTPFRGAAYWTTAGEAKRQAVNAFIRGGGFDSFIDFDAAVRDPLATLQLAPAFDHGDHLHLTDAGYAAMAAAAQTQVAR